MTATARQIVHLADQEPTVILALILDELRELRAAVVAMGGTTSPPAFEQGLVDAATLARELGVSRAWVYENADRIGAVRIGAGSKPRLRFDVTTARAALNAPEARPEPTPTGARRRTTGQRTTAGGVLAIRPRPGGTRR